MHIIPKLLISFLSILGILTLIKKIKIKKKVLNQNRVGDHIWYISSMKKFKKHYPKWKQKYSTNKILKELLLLLKN